MPVVTHKSELKVQGQVFKLQDVLDFIKVVPGSLVGSTRLRVHDSKNYNDEGAHRGTNSHLILEWETIEE